MPDITMCLGMLYDDGESTGRMRDKCIDCYRRTAVPTPHRQSYFTTPPMDERGECKHHWPTVGGFNHASR